MFTVTNYRPAAVSIPVQFDNKSDAETLFFDTIRAEMKRGGEFTTTLTDENGVEIMMQKGI